MAIDPKLFRQVRKALGLTQAELAEQLGLSRVTVNKMEQGRLKRGIPDEIAAKLMVLKVKPAAAPHKPPTCEHCGSVLSAVTWTCVRGEHCPGVKADQHLWDNEEEDDQ